MRDGAIHYKLYLLKLTIGVGNIVFKIINIVSAKDGDLRLSASNACLPKTEISALRRNVCFSHPHVTNYICSHCTMCYKVRKKECSSLFWYKAIIVWFSQFIMTVVQN